MLHQKLADLNMFPSIPPSTNPRDILVQLISTRIFLIVFLLCFIILLTWISTITMDYTVTIRSPDLEKYRQLYEEHAQVLNCFCHNVSIEYKMLMNIHRSLHPICNSTFITDEWIMTIAKPIDSLRVDDFRLLGPFVFQALRSLCELSQASIAIYLAQLYSAKFVSATVLPEYLFYARIKEIIDEFILSTTNNFLLSLRKISNTTQANAILSAIRTNYYLYQYEQSKYIVSMWMPYDNGCHCGSSSKCITQSSIYEAYSVSSRWDVPGFYAGCFVLEALRQSDLRCLHNETCLQQLDVRLHPNRTMMVTSQILNHSKHFAPTSTVDNLINEMLVDRWGWDFSYDVYYDLCRPSTCFYKIIKRNDFVSIIAIMLGLVGGLSKSLKFMVPRLVRLIMKHLQCRRRVHPALTIH